MFSEDGPRRHHHLQCCVVVTKITGIKVTVINKICIESLPQDIGLFKWVHISSYHGGYHRSNSNDVESLLERFTDVAPNKTGDL